MSSAVPKPIKILLVEDTTAIADVMKIKLEASGYEVDVVTDGEQALAALAKDRFSLMLLDLMMPKMDGFTVLEEMKKLKLKVPVIVTSNLGQPEDIAKVKKLGAVDYFMKVDLSLAEMVERIKKQL